MQKCIFPNIFVTEQASALYQASIEWRILFKQPKLVITNDKEVIS